MQKLKGYVYVLVHPIMDGYVKIGRTTRTPIDRAKELSDLSKTSLLGKFIVAYEILVDNCVLVEKAIHHRLKEKRSSTNREFFYHPLKETIQLINETINDINNQKRLGFEKHIEWWSNLDIIWQCVFKSHITYNHIPNSEEIYEGLISVINYCREDNIRKLVTQILAKKDFKKLLPTWFNKLNKETQKKILDFIPLELSENKILEIQSLEHLNCRGNLNISDLRPIIELKRIKILDCSNTSISNLEPLKKLQHLEEVHMNILELKSIKPLVKLKGLRKVSLHGTEIMENDLGVLQKEKPECELIKNVYNSI